MNASCITGYTDYQATRARPVVVPITHPVPSLADPMVARIRRVLDERRLGIKVEEIELPGGAS